MKKQNVTHGTIYLLFSQAVFLSSGYAIHIGLARLLGPSEYGIYAVVISLMTMVNLILTKGIPQAVSKYLAHNDGNVYVIMNTALKIQLVLSLVIFSVFFLSAGQIALLLNDDSLSPFIRASAFIIPGYAIYSILLGYLNGLQEYKMQAIISISYSIIKVTFILTLVLIGYAVRGAIIGFVFAPMATLLLVVYLKRHNWIRGWINEKKIKDFRSFVPQKVLAKHIVSFSVPIILFSVAINLIINIDLFFVKTYLTNHDVGVYAAASTISKVPFYLLTGMYVALFPVISRTTFRNEIEKTQKYILDSLKYSLIVLIPVVLIISISSNELITILYSNKYADGGLPLIILIIGLGFYSLLFLFTTILNGSGMPQISLIMGLIVLGLDILLNFILVPEYHLIGAAVATSIACFIGFVISGGYVYLHIRNSYSLTQI